MYPSGCSYTGYQLKCMPGLPLRVSLSCERDQCRFSSPYFKGVVDYISICCTISLSRANEDRQSITTLASRRCLTYSSGKRRSDGGRRERFISIFDADAKSRLASTKSVNNRLPWDFIFGQGESVWVLCSKDTNARMNGGILSSSSRCKVTLQVCIAKDTTAQNGY